MIWDPDNDRGPDSDPDIEDSSGLIVKLRLTLGSQEGQALSGSHDQCTWLQAGNIFALRL